MQGKNDLLILFIIISSVSVMFIFFPDPSTIDSDNDGIMDDKDVFPHEETEHADSDGDGIGDNEDKFPNDPAASKDSDDDGYPDSWNEGKSQSDSTSIPKLIIDEFPYDPNEYNDEDNDGIGDNSDAFPDDPTEACRHVSRIRFQAVRTELRRHPQRRDTRHLDLRDQSA